MKTSSQHGKKGLRDTHQLPFNSSFEHRGSHEFGFFRLSPRFQAAYDDSNPGQCPRIPSLGQLEIQDYYSSTQIALLQVGEALDSRAPKGTEQ
jgi:hypothetical protein